MDLGFFLTRQAIRRQLAAMPHELYLIRLIHGLTRRPFPGQRLWTTSQLCQGAAVRFLRARNWEGCDVYLRPYAPDRNAGYLLVDLDHAPPRILDTMRTQGHEPCVVLETSPGHLQAWVRVSPTPLDPTLATAIGQHLARSYGADLASSDGRHLGRLAGFTNQKLTRRQPNGFAPWVKLLHAQRCWASQRAALLATTLGPSSPWGSSPRPLSAHPIRTDPGSAPHPPCPSSLPPTAATELYSRWLHRLRIPQRFSPPDWSIADLWIARALLRDGSPVEQVRAVLQAGSPGFPRHHWDPDDYLCRTLARATRDLHRPAFPARDPTAAS